MHFSSLRKGVESGVNIIVKTQYVQFGCGLCAPENWLNFDASPLLRLQKLPLVGRFVPSGPFGRFPGNVRYGDVVKGLPIPENSVKYLYCSHILEHLSLTDCHHALQNCYRHLEAGGIFRLVLPDLEAMAKQYVNTTEAKAAHEFMRVTWLGKEARPRSFSTFLREWLGGSHHLWMWDYRSLAQALESVGFTEIRRAYFGDSGIAAYTQLEDPDRWDQLSLGIQCRKA